MLRFSLEAAGIIIATEIFMNCFVAPAVVSRDNGTALLGTFAGIAWAFLAGGAVIYLWTRLKGPETFDSTQAKDPFDVLKHMENPEQAWLAKQKGETK